MKWYAKLYTRLVFIFLYLPIIVLIAFSFNESKSRASWTGFSFHWYKELFHNELILSSLRNTLIIALAASVIALVLGTMAAVGIYAMRRKWFKSLVMNITYLPILILRSLPVFPCCFCSFPSAMASRSSITGSAAPRFRSFSCRKCSSAS